MSLSIPSVNHSYAAGPIGFEAIGAYAEIGANSSLHEILEAYSGLFEQYSKMHATLLEQLGTVIGCDNWNAYTDTEGKLDLSKIFDDYELIDVLNLEQGQCKEGAKAYKYYLRESISQLNNLYSWKEHAGEMLAQLEALGEGHENEARYFITQLEIADKHAQEAIKAFTQHAVVKYLSVEKTIKYNDGTEDKEEESHENYQACEFEYSGVLRKEGEGEYTYNSKLAANYASLDELRKIQTDKFIVTREITTTYYKDSTKAERADKYDDLAYREMTISDAGDDNPSATNAIMLFDELSLLDKLKYINLYYKIADRRYVYPQNATTGFPCIQPSKNLNPADDTAELGQLEMFYVGYLINRDGPANALASFMEVKSVAIQSQIVLMSYRLKALRCYVKLLNKGLEALNKSQSPAWNGEGNPTVIPYISYFILQYLGGDFTRSLMYFKDADGKFLSEGFKNPYLIIQHNNGKKGYKEIESEDASGETVKYEYHLTEKNNYLLVEATDDDNGINSLCTFFLNHEANDSSFLLKMNGVFATYESYGPTFKEADRKLRWPESEEEGEIFSLYSGVSVTDTEKLELNPGCYFLHLNESDPLSETSPSITYLPKELEVTQADLSSTFEPPKYCVDWRGGGSWDKSDQKESLWQSYVSQWTKTYDTVISNYQSQLEYVQKSVESLRKKVDTFDTMSSNFRNKAYTIYNKIVNKIS